MKRWAVLISTLVLCIPGIGLANDPSMNNTTTTTQTVTPLTPKQKQKLTKTITVYGKQRTEENRIYMADQVTSELLGTKPYRISGEEAARRHKRDIIYLSYKKRLGQISNDELQELSRAVNSELQRRGH